MPYILTDLVVDRVDLVDEGANSAAFIEVFKRKELTNMELSEILSKLKPEHASVIQQKLDDADAEITKMRGELDTANASLTEANESLTKANDEIAVLKAAEPAECSCDGEADESGVCKACGRKKRLGFDEANVLKSLPENLRAEFIKMRTQKEAAEAMVRKAAEEKAEAEAVAKAATLKSLPVEQSTLVSILKSCDQQVVDLLTTVAAAIDGTVLGEVGTTSKSTSSTDAWSKIEAEATKVATRDNVSKQKAIGTVIKEQPDLYKEYLNGGAN